MRKIQFCCGDNRLEGWENYDMDVDITKPLPFDSNSIDRIFIEHGLEHIDMRDGLRFLKDCYRILLPGGRLRICVPTLRRTDMDHGWDLVMNHGHQMMYSFESLEQFLKTAGFRPLYINMPKRLPIDGHWKIIGKEKDDLETLRMEAIK